MPRTATRTHKMPRVGLDGLTINYEVQGEGEPLLLIHYTSADHASWAFQLPAYTDALQLHRARSSRRGRERQAIRTVLDRGPSRPSSRFPRCDRDRAGPRRGRVVRG